MNAIRGRNGSALLAAAIVLVIPLLVWSFSSNPPLGNTGAPGQNHCQTCHTGGLGGGNVTIAFSGGGTSYTPGVAQTLTVTVNDPNSTTVNWGFEMTAFEGATATTPGSFAAASSNVNVATSASYPGLIFARHLNNTTNTFQVTWTPPAASVYSGPVVFYAASVAGDGTQADADSLYQTSVTLTAAAAPNFTLTASPTAVSVAAGGSGTSTVTTTVSGGFNSAVTLSATGAPSGTTVSFSPNPIAAPGSGTSTMTIAVGASTVAGTYPITVTGTGGGLTHTATVTLTVTAAPDFTLTASPTAVSVAVGHSGTSTLTTTVSGGFSSAVTLSAAGAPSGTTVSFGPNPIPAPGSGTSTMTIAVGTTTATGTYPITVTGTGGGVTHTATVTLTVTAAASNLILNPTTLSYSYQQGGTVPAAQNVAVTSSGAALNYTVASNQTWLTATPASGTTPGSVSVAVDPTGLAVGTHTGMVTVTAPSAANNPQTVAVTLTVTAAASPNLILSPATLSYSYQIGGTAPAAKNLAVSSSGTALNYTVASDQTWLTATPASGTTPGSVSVAVDPTGLAVGTHTGTVTFTAPSAANNPQTVAVTLIITNQGTGQLIVKPKTLSFSSGSSEHEDDDNSSLRKRLYVTSSGGPLSFTAEAMGGTWLSVNPSHGTTPAKLTVSVSPAGLAKGTYVGQIKLSIPGGSTSSTVTVPVTFTVSHSGGEDDGKSISATTYTSDPNDTGAVAARWVYGAGVPDADLADPTNQGLLLTNNAGASSKARAGAIFHNVGGINLSVLGFDLREGSLCTARGPRFIVVTTDNVVHTVGGCAPAQAQASPAKGWTRYRFDPAQAKPAITPDSTVKSIALMLDDGPETGGGMAVVDNININGTIIGHD